MSRNIYIRPLCKEDAFTSYKWRNNARIWRYTMLKPDKHITPEMEFTWLQEVIQRADEKRFAICLSENDNYIGNIYLNNIRDNTAEMHLFIGDIKYWGKGRALEAIRLILQYGFETLHLEMIYSRVNKNNLAAIALGKFLKFGLMEEYYDDQLKTDFIKGYITKEMFSTDEKQTVRPLSRVALG